MESLSETSKRKSLDKSFDEDAVTKTKRNNGSETMCYLKTRYEQDYKLRKQEIELKKHELELQKNEQQQFFAQQHILQQQMQMQNKMMLTMLEKVTKKND